MFARLRSLVRTLGRRRRFEAELDEELRFHLAARADDLVKGGMPRPQAERRARLELGGAEGYKEEVRAARGMRLLDELAGDLRFALRSWRKQPGLTAAVIATLTLGIAVSTAGFTVINATFFRPHIHEDARGFAKIWAAYTEGDDRPDDWWAVDLDDVQAIQGQSRSLRQITARRKVSGMLGGHEPSELGGVLVTCNFLSFPGGPPPLLGRLLDGQDCAAAAPVMVLNEPMWRHRFGADPQVVGRKVSYDKHVMTIVGVAGADPDWKGKSRAYMPYTLAPSFTEAPAWAKQFEVTARLAPGYSNDDATAELAVIFAQQDRAHPGRRSAVVVTDGSHAQDPSAHRRGKAMVAAGLLLGVVAMIVLLVSANVVTLLLARAHARRHEIAVRLSLGAGRARLLKMLLTETLLLAVVAAALSLPLSGRLPERVLSWLEPGASFPFHRADWRVWGFLVAVTLLCALAAGLAPALEALKVDLTESMKGRLPGSAGGGRGRDLRGLLVGGQIAVSSALLAGAALCLHGYTRVALVDPGFDTRRTLFAPLPISATSAAPAPTVHQQLVRELGALPGIEAVAFSHVRPPGGQPMQVVSDEGQQRRAEVNAVSPEFFATLGVPLLRGRGLQAGDPAAAGRVPVVVAKALARSLWPGRDPLGRALRGPQDQRFEVVGMAGDVSTPGRREIPALYRPLAPGQDMVLVRFSSEPAATYAAVEAAIRRAAPGLQGSARTFQTAYDHNADELGRWALVAVALGLAALALALIGVYGVVSFAARRRMKEMGIRLALGAQAGDILRALLRPVAVRVGIGLTVGLLLAVAGSWVALRALSDVDVVNPLPYAVATLVMAAAAAAAMWRPARRAMSADPMAALRDE